jgi:hypothetical protein
MQRMVYLLINGEELRSDVGRKREEIQLGVHGDDHA